MNYKDYIQLTINGRILIGKDIVAYCNNQQENYFFEIAKFVEEWLKDTPFIEVHTSGSTGTPKTMMIEKNAMLQSAKATANYFNFLQNDNALLALPVKFIAGKMMVVRAFLSKLNLICVQPNANPLLHLPSSFMINFAPITPMQLSQVDTIDNIEKILLGGAPLDARVEEICQTLKCEIFHGYGMTETLSHIAIRKVNGRHKSKTYTAMPNVTLWQDDRNCLVIHAPYLPEEIFTNDIVELINEKEFIWKGRFDNVINSGGLKLFPEEIEQHLFKIIKEPFFVAGVPDELLGAKLCLFIEGNPFNTHQLQSLQNDIRIGLDKYSIPKNIYFASSFCYTETGKIQRQQTIQKVLH